MRDVVAGTPLVDCVPGRAARFTSSRAYAALLADGAVTGAERTCRHGRRYARFCHVRSDRHIEEAWRKGWLVDWERMLLLKGFGKE